MCGSLAGNTWVQIQEHAWYQARKMPLWMKYIGSCMIVIITLSYSLQHTKWCKTIATDRMATLGLTGLHLETSQEGPRVGGGRWAITCAYFYVCGSWSRKVFYFMGQSIYQISNSTLLWNLAQTWTRQRNFLTLKCGQFYWYPFKIWPRVNDMTT